MKHSVLFAVTAVLALSACGKAEAPGTEATATASAEAATAAETPGAAAAPAAFTAGEAPSRAFMVGTWGEGDECEMPLTFAADGSIKDGPFAKWDIKDGNLVMEDGPTMKLTVVDEKTMQSQLEGKDKARTLKRCG